MKFRCRRAFSMLFVFVALFCNGVANAQGIDVSKYQGKIDWAKVAKSKTVKFVYIRATEGTSIKDPKYKSNVDSARKAGLYVGSYHVYSSKTTASQQFANFKSVVSKKKQDLVPVLDIEGYHSGRLDMARVDKLLQLMESEYGVKPMIYTSEKVYFEHFTAKKYSAYHIFVAKYKGSPSIRYTLWQHSRTGRVKGISGDVDLDKFGAKHSLYDIAMPKLRKNLKKPADETADSTKKNEKTDKADKADSKADKTDSAKVK